MTYSLLNVLSVEPDVNFCLCLLPPLPACCAPGKELPEQALFVTAEGLPEEDF